MNRVFAAIRAAFIQLLDRKLLRRTKRLIFLASLFARVKAEKYPEFSSPVLNKLNTLMELSHRDSALVFPVGLSRVIWHGKTLTELCGDPILEGEVTPERLDAATDKIIANMPQYMRYGRPEDITKDVRKLLMHRAIFAAA